MADIRLQQTKINNLRQTETGLQTEVMGLKEQLNKLESQRLELSRNPQANAPALNALTQQIQGTQATLTQRNQAVKNARDAVDLEIGKLVKATTPQQLMGSLSADVPVLLMPLRIETKFVANQLCVRAYPDDLAVMTHEPKLTENERLAAESFWQDIFQAGEQESKQIEAWGRLTEAAISWHRAAWIVREYKPTNSNSANPLALSELPQFDPYESSTSSWLQAAKAGLLPEKLVFIGFNGDQKVAEVIGSSIPANLFVGPDPTKAINRYTAEDITPADIAKGIQVGDIRTPEEIDWLFDFDKAVANGMGIRMNTPAGFEKLLVMGVRFSESEETGRQNFEKLLENHYYSLNGLSLIPNGTPTNNTDDADSGFANFDLDMTESFRLVFGEPQFTSTPTGDSQKTDGFLLTERMGLTSNLLLRTQNASGLDQLDSKAMHQALWHGTLGYFLEEMLQPVADPQKASDPPKAPFNTTTIESVRQFFINNVTGRGTLPAFRVGKQPYGILPTSAFAGWTATDAFEKRLTDILKTAYGYFKTRLVPKVSTTAKSNDPDKDLIDVLGLQAYSASFFQRYALSSKQYADLVSMSSDKKYSVHIGQNASFLQDAPVNNLLAQWMDSQLYDLLFFEKYFQLFGGIVEKDKVPVSESAPIRPFLEDKNYLQWLADSDPATIEKELFPNGVAKPNALLYLLLRHALRHSYVSNSADLLIKNNLATAKVRDLVYLNVNDKTKLNSKQLTLYTPQPTITGVANKTLAQFVFERSKAKDPKAVILTEVRDALSALAGRPSAKLERAFAEHIDLCSYRLDAWLTGLANQRLEKNRQSRKASNKPIGFYVGGYGWLENVRPTGNGKTEKNQAVIPPELRSTQKLFEDARNGGYTLTPSPTHAVAASVLRNGYLTHAQRGNPGPMAVNLSSERVRTALSLIEGVNNGQYIGALLGYQFERALHESSLTMDQFIYAFRRKYPLVDDRLTTNTGQTTEASAARNVVDGVKLVEDFRTQTNPTAFVKAIAADISNPGVTAILQAIGNLLDSFDAVGDLMLSESVYQVVQGNYDRAAGAMKALQEGRHIPQPEIINTPRGGFSLLHRAALLLIPAEATTSATPRAAAEPTINQWLTNLLPPMDEISVAASITFTDGRTDTKAISIADLKLEPIDLLYVTGEKAQNDLTELSERIGYFIRTDLGEDVTVQINYTTPVTGTSLFSLLPVLNTLRSLISSSRSAGAKDFLTNQRSNQNDTSLKTHRRNLTELMNRLTTVSNAFSRSRDALADAIDKWVSAPNPDETGYQLARDNGFLNSLRDVLWSLSFWGLRQTIPTSAEGINAVQTPAEQQLRATLRQNLLDQATLVLNQMNQQLNQAQKALTNASTATEDDQLSLLTKAAQALVGSGFTVLPQFTVHNPDELQSAKTDSDSRVLFEDEASAFPEDEWLYGIARVRPAMQQMETLQLLSPTPVEMKASQLPYLSDDRWLALQIPEKYKETFTDDTQRVYRLEQDRVMLHIHYGNQFDETTPAFQPDGALCGFLLDEWTEEIPLPTITAGISAHFDRPNSEPPQTLLLAVSPVPTGNWTWDNLVQSVTETFELAKVRAVEPSQIDQSPFSHLLPAVLLSVTTDKSTLSTNLADNNFITLEIAKLMTTKYNALI